MDVMFKTLKVQLGVAEADKSIDVQIQFALDSAVETVLNYCGIEEIPEGLTISLIRMAMAIYRNEQPGDSSNPQAVKSISEGDTSTSFSDIMTQSFRDSLLNNYKKQLNRYRKVVF